MPNVKVSLSDIIRQIERKVQFPNATRITSGLCWEVLTEERLNNPLALERYGYKVYSQNEEDGIIQEIFHRIGMTNKFFVEFGVQDGLESNGHYLLHRGWSGLWIESDSNAVEQIQIHFSKPLRKGQLFLKQAFITRENINEILQNAPFPKEIDLLSIDVDGNDYYIWEAITAIQPRVVVIEYNGKFPPDYSWKMEYEERYVWDGTDKHGASLKALEELGEELGYQLVGTNLRGVNAFFVKKSLAEDKFYQPATAEALYNPLRLELEFLSFFSGNSFLGSYNNEN